MLSTQPQDVKQVRILNRILALSPTGLQYEADPRHVEHLTAALRLQDCRRTGVPGVKNRAILSEEGCGNEESDRDVPVAACTPLSKISQSTRPQPQHHDHDHDNQQATQLHRRQQQEAPKDTAKEKDLALRARRRKQKVRFANDVKVRLVRPYSEQFPHHPSKIVLTGPVLSNQYKVLTDGVDPYTGKTSRIMNQRTVPRPEVKRRQLILESCMLDGAAWEEDSSKTLSDFVSAIGGKRHFRKKENGSAYGQAL